MADASERAMKLRLEPSRVDVGAGESVEGFVYVYDPWPDAKLTKAAFAITLYGQSKAKIITSRSLSSLASSHVD